MQRRFISTSRLVTTAAAVTLASGLSVGLVGTPAFAADNCSAYGAKCPSVAPTVISTPTVKGTTITKEPSTLPFTGGEFVLMGSAGVAALGAGAVLVVVGRRRRTAA